MHITLLYYEYEYVRVRIYNLYSHVHSKHRERVQLSSVRIYLVYIYIYIYIWEYRYALVMNEPYAWISIFWICSFSVCSVRVYAHALFLSSVPYSHHCSVITECTVRELKRRYRCAVTRARVARLLSIERDLKTALSDDAAYVLRFLPSRRPANWSFAAAAADEEASLKVRERRVLLSRRAHMPHNTTNSKLHRRCADVQL